MKKYLIIFSVLFLNSCNTQTKETINYYGTGEVESKRTSVNDKIITTVFYKSGKIKSLNYFEDGFINGTAYLFYNNGLIMEIRNYKDGSLNGESIQYFANGNKKSEGNWKNGNQVGIWKYYYPNGKIKESKNQELEGKLPILIIE